MVIALRVVVNETIAPSTKDRASVCLRMRVSGRLRRALLDVLRGRALGSARAAKHLTFKTLKAFGSCEETEAGPVPDDDSRRLGADFDNVAV